MKRASGSAAREGFVAGSGKSVEDALLTWCCFGELALMSGTEVISSESGILLLLILKWPRPEVGKRGVPGDSGLRDIRSIHISSKLLL